MSVWRHTAFLGLHQVLTSLFTWLTEPRLSQIGRLHFRFIALKIMMLITHKEDPQGINNSPRLSHIKCHTLAVKRQSIMHKLHSFLSVQTKDQAMQACTAVLVFSDAEPHVLIFSSWHTASKPLYKKLHFWLGNLPLLVWQITQFYEWSAFSIHDVNDSLLQWRLYTFPITTHYTFLIHQDTLHGALLTPPEWRQKQTVCRCYGISMLMCFLKDP